MSAPEARFEVGVVVARRAPRGPWASPVWLPRAVLPAAPVVARWTALGQDGADELFYAGSAEIVLEAGETAHYRDNLDSGRPSLWVLLASTGDEVALATVTANPYEGESLADIGGTLEAVPMPPEIEAGVAAFVQAFHRETVFVKRSRDRADTEALGPRQPGRRPRREDVE